MKTLHLATAAAAVTLPLTTAQEEVTCTCSPTSYSFKLNFAGNCDPAEVDFSGPGIEGDVCLFSQGSNPDDVSDIEFGGGGPLGTRRLSNGLRSTFNFVGGLAGQARREAGQKEQWKRALSSVDLSSHIEHARNLASEQRIPHRRAQGSDTPTTITSVTFLEADTTPQLNIINQDSTYFDISASDGDVLDYTSISASLDPSLPLSDQIDDVPGGVMLVLFGVNADNVVVQNTVAWAYTKNYCEGVPVTAGDDIGWIVLEDFGEPLPEFCGAVTASPTPSPIEATTTTEATKVSTTTTEPADDITTTTTEDPLPPATTTQPFTTYSTGAKASKEPSQKGSKSAGVFAKSTKKSSSINGEDMDAKAMKVGKAEKMSMPHTAKAGKLFKESKSGKSSKAESDTKSGKKSAGDTMPSGKSQKTDAGMTKGASKGEASAKAEKVADAKAGKHGSSDDSSSSSSKSSSAKGYGKAKGDMSMMTKGSSSSSSSSSAKSGKSSSAKSGKTKAEVADAKAGKHGDSGSAKGESKAKGMMSMPHSDAASAKAEKEAKATKVFKTKEHEDKTASGKADKSSSSKSAKAADADAKAGKESSSKSKGEGKAKSSSGMSMPKAPSSKAEKATSKTDKAASSKAVDAKAEKVGSSSAKSDKSSSSSSSAKAEKSTGMLKTKSSKNMSLPTKAKSEKSSSSSSSSSSKSAKAKTAKASKSDGIHDAKAEKASSGKAMKADPINTSVGYREIIGGKPGDE